MCGFVLFRIVAHCVCVYRLFVCLFVLSVVCELKSKMIYQQRTLQMPIIGYYICSAHNRIVSLFSADLQQLACSCCYPVSSLVPRLHPTWGLGLGTRLPC